MPTFRGRNIKEIKTAWNTFFIEHPEYKVLHSHVRSYASIYIPIAKKYGVRTIIHSHSRSNGSGISSIVKMIMQYPLRFQADYFFGCSKEAGEWLFGKNIVRSEKYHMFQNAIDTDQYLPNLKIRSEYRKKLGIEEKRVFLHVGRLHSAKNHIFLLEVFKKVIQELPNSVLLIVGSGELKSEINKKIKELQLEDSVKMLGNRTDIPNLLQASDCFLFPSRWEGLPVSVVEAQAAGIPCLISDHITKDVGLSELVVYLPIDSGTDIWVETIKKLDYQRKNVISNIKQAGFDVKSTAEWLENFYRGLANE
jgi:glycosyltransferase involved in cell wall biosynthesis